MSKGIAIYFFPSSVRLQCLCEVPGYNDLSAVVVGSWAFRIVFEQAESILVFLLDTHIPAVVRYF